MGVKHVQGSVAIKGQCAGQPSAPRTDTREGHAAASGRQALGFNEAGSPIASGEHGGYSPLGGGVS